MPLLLLSLLSVAAAEPTLNVQHFDPAHPVSGFATVHAARILPRARAGFDLYVSYGYRVFQQSELDRGALVSDQVGIDNLTAFHPRLSVAPTSWLQLAVYSPVAQLVTTGPALTAFTGSQGETFGWGDVSGEISFLPLSEARAVGLSFTLGGSAPTGKRSLLLTRGVGTAFARMGLSGVAGPVHIASHVGYRLLPGSSTIDRRVAIDDELSYGLGLGFLLKGELVRFNVEGAGFTVVGPGTGYVLKNEVTARLHTSLEAVGSLRVATPTGIGVVLGAGAGLTSAPGTPVARGFLALAYLPTTEPDRDDDGIPNHADGCRDVPEDLDGYEDDDGCPDDDNDGDGVDDEIDGCVDEPEDRDGHEDLDGCPDRDNDLDRVADLADACPDEPEDRDGFEDADGCPDPDNDGDGVLDVVDKCPMVPEDLDGLSDADGCPEQEYDSDADGVIDNYDPCPDDPEDVDGYQDDDGCPEPDNDGDGIGDAVDLCPDAAEVFNGNLDEDGCPDEVKAVIKGDRIVILEKVYFYVNEARIRPESFDVLQAVADTMAAHPELALVRVEGHTDADGSDAYNLKLSQRRSEAVVTWLAEAGVAPERLTARGYGEQYPIDTNTTPEGKERNRRVEFVVVPASGEAP